MTPSEQHKRNELDNCIRKYNKSGDINAFKRANELRAELGMEQVSKPNAELATEKKSKKK